MIPIRCAAAAIALMVTPALAETLVLPSQSTSGCPEPSQRQGRIDRALVTIEALTERIEHISPADELYLKTELEAATKQQNNARYNLAARSPAYLPYQVWLSHAEVVNALRSGRDSTDVRVHIIAAGEALSSIPGFFSDIADYLAMDRNRSPRVYDESMYYFNRANLTSNLGSLVTCAARAIGPQ